MKTKNDNENSSLKIKTELAEPSLYPGSLSVGEQCVLKCYECIRMFVTSLLQQELRLKQIVHGCRASMIGVSMYPKVLIGLFYTLFGKQQLLPGLGDVIPCLLSSDVQQLRIVGQLLLRFLPFEFFTLNGMRTSPPI